MPEHLRAFIVVLVLASVAWLFIQPRMAQIASHGVAQQWRNLWFALTIAAFLVDNFWLYGAFAVLLLWVQRLAPVSALAAYCLLLMAVPAASVEVPGFGLINYFFAIDQPRLLALLLLAPAALALSRQPGVPRLGTGVAEKLVLGFVLLAALLQLRESNITSSLRGAFYLGLEVFLPYYVASRAVRRVEDFKQVLAAFSMACALLGVLVIFETVRHWNLYVAMTSALGLRWGYGGYLARDNLLRASGSVGVPIVLGYVMMIGLGFWLFLQQGQRRSARSMAPALLMAGGLLAALSRGPWVGMAAAVLTFVWTGRRGMRNTLLLGAGAIAALLALSMVGFGQKILSFLPFIGSVDDFNVTYRQRLFDNALIVVQRHFWLGSVDYLKTPEMQSMIQGQGIIDVVNTFIGVALDYGAIGLTLFAGFFAMVAWKLWRTQARLAMEDERRLLGRSLLATLVGILVTIATVSNVGVIAHLYWLVAGLGVAWLDMVRRGRIVDKTPAQPISAG